MTDRPAISPTQERALWAAAAGRCMLCNALVTESETLGLPVSIGEMAHNIGWSKNSPRGDAELAHRSGDQLVAICQQRLNDHGVRRYGFGTWLVLNASQAPLHSSTEGPFVVGCLKRPAPWYYLDAYVCLANNWEEGRRFFRVPPLPILSATTVP